MPQAAFISLVLLLIVLAVLGGMMLRRMTLLVARTRGLEAFQASVVGLDAELGSIVDPLVGRLDQIRRRSGDPTSLAAGIDAIQADLAALVVRGRGLRPPRALAEDAAAMLTELDRATRASDLVEHGLDALLAHRGHRELEAQTSLKRAALNLRNARGASAIIARRVAAVRPADLIRQAEGLETVPVRAPSPLGYDLGDVDEGGLSDHRM